jgi:hypothetical protein
VEEANVVIKEQGGDVRELLYISKDKEEFGFSDPQRGRRDNQTHCRGNFER